MGINGRKKRKFTFGKYKGKDILEIICVHTGYILWLLQNTKFRLNNLEQEVFDAIAKGIIEGQLDYVYDKYELKKFIKNKNIISPYVCIHGGYCGVIKELKNTKLGQIISYYLHKRPKVIPHNYLDTLLTINYLLPEDDDISMSEILY